MKYIFYSSLIYAHMLTPGGLGFSLQTHSSIDLNGSTYGVNDFVFLSSTKAVVTVPAQHPPSSHFKFEHWVVGEVLGQA